MVLISINRIFFALALFLLFHAELSALDQLGLGKKVVKEVDKIFESECQLEQINLKTGGQNHSDLLRAGDQVYLIQESDAVLGFILSTSAKGRYDSFDYVIIYATDLSVKSVMVTTYRSSHGAGICSKGWLKQFRGYQGEELRLGKEIDSISGATISATSMVEDMERSHQLMQDLGAKKMLN